VAPVDVEVGRHWNVFEQFRRDFDHVEQRQVGICFLGETHGIFQCRDRGAREVDGTDDPRPAPVNQPGARRILGARRNDHDRTR